MAQAQPDAVAGAPVAVAPVAVAPVAGAPVAGAPVAVSSPELNIVVFNVHSSDKGVKAADRHHCLKEIVDSVLADHSLASPSSSSPTPLVFLCQESIKTPKHKILCQKLGHKPKDTPRKEEAGIYHRLHSSKPQQVRYVDVGKLRQIEDGLGLEAGVPFELARLMACVLTLPAGGGQRILLVSWHGPETKVKRNPELKSLCFRRLVRFCERVRRSELCATVVIGGDFNMSPDSALRVMKSTDVREGYGVDGDVQGKYTPPADRRGLVIKDFIVYWPENHLRLLDTSVIRPDYRRNRGSRPFDHPIVSFKFGRLIPPEE